MEDLIKLLIALPRRVNGTNFRPKILVEKLREAFSKMREQQLDIIEAQRQIIQGLDLIKSEEYSDMLLTWLTSSFSTDNKCLCTFIDAILVDKLKVTQKEVKKMIQIKMETPEISDEETSESEAEVIDSEVIGISEE